MTTVSRIGQSVGRYQLELLLGRGGMAEVYRAADTRLGRAVAVKLILPHHAVHADFRERFAREARLVAALDHPNILPVYDFGEEAGQPFLVMPLLEGGTLADRMSGEPFPLAQVTAWAAQLGGALDAAHAAGILHRDVKPSNVLIGKDGRVVLADFGIAKSVEASTRLTTTGAVVGTPAYMAPELARGESAGRASDLYALAVMVYELLSGNPPFLGDSALAILHRHATEPVPPVTRKVPALPAAVDAVLDRALAKEPAERQPTCSAFALELAEAAEGRPPAARAATRMPPAALPPTAASRAATAATPATAPTVLSPASGGREPSGNSYATGMPVARGRAAAARGGRARTYAWAAAAVVAVGVLAGLYLVAQRGRAAGEEAKAGGGVATPNAAAHEVAASSTRGGAAAAGTLPPRGEGARARLGAPLPTAASAPAAALAPTGAERVAAAGGPASHLIDPNSQAAAPGPLAAAKRAGERAAGMMRPTRRLGERDYREVLELIAAVPSIAPRNEASRAVFSAVEPFCKGGLAWVAGDTAGARRELATAAAAAAQGSIPVAFPLLVLREGSLESLPDWQLAFAFGDPRGDAERLLGEARLPGSASAAPVTYAEAVLERWAGRHGAAARRAAEARGANAGERAQLAQLEAEELAMAGDAEGSARAFDRALADSGSARGAMAFEAAIVLAQRLGRRDLGGRFFEAACSEGIARACGEGRPAGERKPLPFGGRRPRRPGAGGAGG